MFDSTLASNYTVGWICALPVPEWQASRMLLDEEYEEEPMLPNARYQYVYGKINGHHVVMGCLPDSQMGATPAAHVASEMQLLFPSLRFGLLVGVGGGVWSEAHDVRLGDVVVSRPDSVKRTGGVVQYDFGKAIQHEGFQEIGSLNMPPEALLSAVGKARSALPTRSKFAEYLRTFQKSKDEAPEYAGMPDVADRLFGSDYTHPEKHPTCKSCKEDQEIHRPPQPTIRSKVHYGTIASGNQVMKDAKKRDRIAKKHDILCFEMEAAGLMNYFPCLVIRGICDYCDSHKNKEWQPYAAAAAATYAKEVLRNLAPQKVNQLATLRQIQADAPQEILNTLPYDRDDRFVGRASEIAEMNTRLFVPERHTRLALEGLGGIGKSQIAIEYAYRLKEQRPDIHMFWIHTSTYERFADDYSALSLLLHIRSANDTKANHLHLVANWLRSPMSGQWLLILDNANDDRIFGPHTRASSEKTRNTILPYIPQKVGCAVLITSRVFQAAMTLVGNDKSRILSIEPLSTEDAAQLIRGKALETPRCTPGEAEELAERLDCIPLAISQAMAYIDRRQLASVPIYIRELQDDASKLLSQDHHDLRRALNEVPNSVLRTWAISLQQIVADRPSAAELLYTLCWLDKDSIPLWTLYPQHAGLEDDVEILTGFSILSLDASKDTVHMHRLVQVASRSWTAKEPREGRSDWWLLKAFELLEQAYPRLGWSQETWPVCRVLDAHVAAILNQDLQEIPTASREARASLMHALSMFRNIHGRNEEAIRLQQVAVSEKTDLYGTKNESTMAAVHNIVQYYLEGGRLQKALNLGTDIFKRKTTVLGSEHPETLRSKILLSRVQRCLHRFHEAADLADDVLRVSLRVLGARHIDTLNAMNNKMLCLREMGELEAARAIGIELLHRERASQGTNHFGTLLATRNLARILTELGRDLQAEILVTGCVLTSSQLLHHSHDIVLKGVNTLIGSLCHQRRYLEYGLLSRAILSYFQRHHGQDQHNVLITQFDNAQILVREGKMKAAIDIWRYLTPAYSRIYGHAHKHSVDALCAFADSLICKGLFEEAFNLILDFFEHLAKGTSRPEGDMHCAIKFAMLMAIAIRELGRRTDALIIRNELLREISKHSARSHGPIAVVDIANAAGLSFSIALKKELATEAFAAHRITNDRPQRNSWLYQQEAMHLIRPTRSYTKSIDIDPSEQEEPGLPITEREFPRRRWSVACGPMAAAEFADPQPPRDYRKIKEKYKPELNKQQDQVFAIAEGLLEKYGPPTFPDSNEPLPL